MTYSVVVTHRNRNVIVKVDASNEEAAKDVARWLVDHAQHFQAHAGQPVLYLEPLAMKQRA